jgi:hypothetical protein
MKPVDEFIPRVQPYELQEILNKYSGWLDEMVNFGSNLIKWDVEIARGEEEILPPILFLRNYLEYLDACSMLMKQSSIEPCNSILRTLLENFLSIEYLLAEKTHERSLSFLVWNTFENRKRLLSMDGKSENYKKLQSAFQKDKIFKDISAFVFPNIETGIKNNEELVKSEKYKTTAKEYYRTKSKLGGKNPSWYSLYDGPSNIEKLADNLGFNVYYELLYRNFYSSTHGNEIIQGKIAKNEQKGIDIFQIRLSTGAKNTISFCIGLTTYLFKTYVYRRVPTKKEEFDSWAQTIIPIYKELESNYLSKD